MSPISATNRALGALTTLLVCALALAGCGAGAPSPPAAGVGTRLNGPVASKILSIPLVDSHGRTHTLREFRGSTVVISDAMTLCQEACPVDTAAVVQTARRVAAAGRGDDVVFLSITVDPRRDTPQRLAAYRGLFTPVPAGWKTLTGSPADIHRLWKYLGVYWKKVPSDTPAPKDWMTGEPLTYDIEHSDQVIFLDSKAHERFVLSGLPYLAGRKEVPARLYRFMNEKGHRNVTHAEPTAWTVPQALRVLGWLTGESIGS